MVERKIDQVRIRIQSIQANIQRYQNGKRILLKSIYEHPDDLSRWVVPDGFDQLASSIYRYSHSAHIKAISDPCNGFRVEEIHPCGGPGGRYPCQPKR